MADERPERDLRRGAGDYVIGNAEQDHVLFRERRTRVVPTQRPNDGCAARREGRRDCSTETPGANDDDLRGAGRDWRGHDDGK
jgi:hypothetical protein